MFDVPTDPTYGQLSRQDLEQLQAGARVDVVDVKRNPMDFVLCKKIEKTLKKVEDEDFGYCESCGVEIGIRRLEARPTADLCIDC
ncbi:TraR/DksA C4-type zinc finger protein, partial [Salmonella enterica subsp. enterica serovar Virginia]|nr:TraR/DksA C4-type zinc finger protein [Salmonella enterica subsp. enterica serovar Virginia]